jgi:hypothetical protein
VFLTLSRCTVQRWILKEAFGLLIAYPTKDPLCFFWSFQELRAQMYIIHEVPENILLVRLKLRPQTFMFKIPLFRNGHALWTSSNKGNNPRYMSICVGVSTGARLIIWFRFMYILPNHTPLHLFACSLQSAHNCWSPSACMCAYIYCT